MPSTNHVTRAGADTPSAHCAADSVVFALQSHVNYRKDKGYLAAIKPAGRVKATAVFLGIVLIDVALRYVGAGALYSFKFLPFLFVIAIAMVLREVISNRRFKRDYQSRLPPKPPEDCRFACIGAPEEIAEFGGWADVPFEPALFFGRFSIRGRGWRKHLYMIIVVLVMAVWLGTQVGWFVVSFRWNPYFAFITALGVAELATAFMWPTYLRLVPGRLDVLGYGPMSRKPTFVEQYDLRGARIMADLRRSFVSIVHGQGRDARRLEFGISLMRERRKFVYMLFLAAVSSYPPGPVPEDALVG